MRDMASHGRPLMKNLAFLYHLGDVEKPVALLSLSLSLYLSLPINGEIVAETEIGEP